MKSFWLASLLLPMAGYAFGSTCDDKAKAAECTAIAKDGDCPATALTAKWEKATQEMAAMPPAKREMVERAHATLAASCPACKESPATIAFVGRFLDATVALDARYLAACEASKAAAKDCPEAPQAVKDAYAKRIEIGAASQKLFTAFSGAMAPTDSAKRAVTADASARAGLTIAGAPKEFDSIAVEAEKLTATWNGVPAKAAALPAEKKTEMLEAMATLKREVPTCDLAIETMDVLQKGFEHAVTLDRTIGEHCDATAKAGGAESKTPEFAQAKAAGQSRAKATAKVAELIVAMRKSMTPDIFQAKAGTMVGAGQ